MWVICTLVYKEREIKYIKGESLRFIPRKTLGSTGGKENWVYIASL